MIGSSPAIHVQFAHRASGKFRSIEELFDSVSAALPSWVEVVHNHAPRSGARIGTLLANLFWAASLKGRDLVHQTGDAHYTVLGVWRHPVVLTIHDLRFIEEAKGIKRFLFWWLWLYLPCLRANRVTVISEFTKRRLLALCRVNPKKVRVIPNCVATEFVAQPKPWPVGKVKLLHVGSTSNKNLGRVAEACVGLPVQLYILGELTDVQSEELKQRGVEFENYWNFSREQVVELYAVCDLVVFVSTYEGFGMPILEAQAMGRPMLTSNIAPMNDVGGEGALFVDPFHIESIRKGLKELLNDEALRERLVRKGYENVKKYTAKAVAAQYAALYREIIERK